MNEADRKQRNYIKVHYHPMTIHRHRFTHELLVSTHRVSQIFDLQSLDLAELHFSFDQIILIRLVGVDMLRSSNSGLLMHLIRAMLEGLLHMVSRIPVAAGICGTDSLR